MLLKQPFETVHELAAKDATENAYRQEEIIARANPAHAVGRKASGRDYTMDVRMKKQVLAPSVEHGKKADLGAKMFGVGGNLEQGLCGGAE